MGSWSIYENKELLSRYEILGRIGSGSYADVYKGKRRLDDVLVALKEVHDYQSSCREIEALLRLRDQPHVIQLLEYFWLSEDDAVLVLEYLPSDLVAVINEGQSREPIKGLTEAEIKSWMLQLLHGVAACHFACVLHRDLKPSNLLISASGVLKVADFGQARIVDCYQGSPDDTSQQYVDTTAYHGEHDISIAPTKACQSVGLHSEKQDEKVSILATFHKEKVGRIAPCGQGSSTPPSSPLLVEGSSALTVDGCDYQQGNAVPSVDSLIIKKRLRQMDNLDPLNGKAYAEDNKELETMLNPESMHSLLEEREHPCLKQEQSPQQNTSPSGLITEKLASEYFKEVPSPGQSFDTSGDIEKEHLLEEELSHLPGIELDADDRWWRDQEFNPENEQSSQVFDGASERSTEFLSNDVSYYREDVESEYTGCVGTRWYRAPELLYGATSYGTEVDMWAVGCMFGELLLGHAVFPGLSDIDQLSRIVRVLGNPNEKNWPGVSKLPDYGKISFSDSRTCFSLDEFVKAGSREAHELLKRLLTYDPASRLSASEALQDTFFSVEPAPLPTSELKVPSPSMQVKNDEDLTSL